MKEGDVLPRERCSPDGPEAATIWLRCRADRQADRDQTGGQSGAKPGPMPDEAVKDAVLSFIRTADT